MQTPNATARQAFVPTVSIGLKATAVTPLVACDLVWQAYRPAALDDWCIAHGACGVHPLCEILSVKRN